MQKQTVESNETALASVFCVMKSKCK